MLGEGGEQGRKWVWVCMCEVGGGGGGRPLGPCGDGHKAPREVTGHNMSSSQQLILPRSVGMAGGDVRSE